MVTNNRIVGLKEVVTVDETESFCKTGYALAMEFLAASREAVILPARGDARELTKRVEETLAAMLEHRSKCSACEDSCLPCDKLTGI